MSTNNPINDSHTPIIIDAQIECVRTAFPSLSSELDDLKTACHNADTELTTSESANSEEIHEKLEEIQSYLTVRCSNAKEYAGQLAEMELELTDLTEELEDLLD